MDKGDQSFECPHCRGRLVPQPKIRWEDGQMHANYLCEKCKAKLFVPI